MNEVTNFLEHYGIKGMRWGVRRRRGPDGRVSTEAKRKEQILTKAKSQGRNSLTNKELRDVTVRLELERKFNQLTASPQKQSIIKKGHSFVKEVLSIGETANSAMRFAKSPAGERFKSEMNKRRARTSKSQSRPRPKPVEQLRLPRGSD